MPAPLEFEGSPLQAFVESPLHERNSPDQVGGLFIVNEYVFRRYGLVTDPVRQYNLFDRLPVNGSTSVHQLAPAKVVFDQFIIDSGLTVLIPPFNQTGVDGPAHPQYYFFWPMGQPSNNELGILGRGLYPIELLKVGGALQDWPTYNGPQHNNGSVNAIIQGGGGGVVAVWLNSVTAQGAPGTQTYDPHDAWTQSNGRPDSHDTLGDLNPLPAATLVPDNQAHPIFTGVDPGIRFTTLPKFEITPGRFVYIDDQNRLCGFTYMSVTNANQTVLFRAPDFGPVMMAEEMGAGRVVWMSSHVFYGEPGQFDAQLWLNILKWITKQI
jgi:hypothetical protein